MKGHQNLERNPKAERFLFNSRNRKLNENISNYMVEVRRLSQYCECGDSLEEMLCDRLVCGVNHKRTQQRLLSEGASLTLQKALDIALLLESAIRQATAIHNRSQKENGHVTDCIQGPQTQRIFMFIL